MKHAIPRSAFDDRLSIVGMSGSGKTYAAGSAVECLLADGARVIVIDPLGVWWGLRLKSDGRTPAFDLPIFGGPHGDIALTESAGALIGEAVAGMAQSCIVDLSQIGTKAGERRFMLAFLTALYRGINGTQVHIVLDEADMWAPQKLLDKDGEAAKLLGMMETIVRRGRVRGFIPWLITQRPAVLSKDVLSQSDGIISFKLTASQDRAALGAWIEGQADRAEGRGILASLPKLDRGQGVVWIPGRGILETVHFPVKVTFDSSRAPKRGESRSNTVLKPLDLGALRERLSTVEAETRANDPKALKAQIATLQRELGDRSPDQGALQDAYRRGLEDGRASALQDIAANCDPVIRLMQLAVKAVHDAANGAQQFSVWAAAAGVAKPRAAPPLQGRTIAAAPVPRATPARDVSAPPDGLSKPQQRVLASLGFWKSVGQITPTREQVAAVAGYKPGSGNLNNIVSSLTSAGMIEIPAPGCLSLKVDADGLTAEEAKSKLWSILANPQIKIVSAVLGDNETHWPRDDLAAASGYAPGSGNFNNILSSLTSIDLLRRAGTGRVAMSPWAREVLS